jgi:hypothetical protein
MKQLLKQLLLVPCLCLVALSARADLIIEVSGAVRAPGPVVLADRATGRDALAAAGGALPNARLAGLALDRPLAVGAGGKASFYVPFASDGKQAAPTVATAQPAKEAQRPPDARQYFSESLARVRAGALPKEEAKALAGRLAERDRPQIFAQLGKAARDREDAVRLFAVAYLAETRDHQGTGLLIQALQDGNEQVRALAGVTLPQMVEKVRR